jgi:ABC-2 type transport system permease protein
LYIILKPPFFVQANPLYLGSFIVSVILGILIYFMIALLTGFVPFWSPTATWGASFIVNTILVEYLSGALFPLDILPQYIQTVLSYTPFPYMLFFPIEIYLGKISVFGIIKAIAVSGVWVVCLWIIVNAVWKKGLKTYEAYGK